MPFRSSFGWALVGPGNIARRFAGALRGIDDAHLAAVVGRDPDRAAAFAAQWSDGAWSGDSLVEALARRDVQAVYVANPHPMHADAVRAALEAGKPVLCEKPLTPNAPATRALVQLARERGVFLMEAVWTRFLPIYAQVRSWLDAGEIGAVRGMESTFCIERPQSAAPGDRCYSAALGGGALLDIGIYNLTVSRMVLPDVPIRSFDIAATLGGEQVDVELTASLDFGAGRRSQFTCSYLRCAENEFLIQGERGRIVVHGGFWESTTATLERHGHAPLTRQAPFRINGFEYEIEETMRCSGADLVESPRLPHAESLAVVELMDTMRARIGVRYPFES